MSECCAQLVFFPLLTPSSKGEKITAEAHGGPIDIEGVTVALVDDQLRLQDVETWFDPMEMFRQIVSTRSSALSGFCLLILVTGSSRHSQQAICRREIIPVGERRSFGIHHWSLLPRDRSVYVVFDRQTRRSGSSYRLSSFKRLSDWSKA